MPAEREGTGSGQRGESATAEGIRIPCFHCGTCCTCYQAPLTTDELANIASALGMTVPECMSAYAMKVPIKEGYLLRKTDAGCVFLAREADDWARCTVYPSRPRACREWQPGLSRAACLDGLARLKSKGQLAQLDRYFDSEGEKREFLLWLERALSSSGAT